MKNYTIAICNYSNMAASKLHIAFGLKEYMVKMSQNPYLFLTVILIFIFSCFYM